MNIHDLDRLEKDSIRAFVQSCDHLYAGARVLDLGCGKAPYRPIVEQAGGEYVGFDRAEFPGNVSGADVGPDEMALGTFEVVLSTQTVQYVDDPALWLEEILLGPLGSGGHLVLTYPTCWPEIRDDLWRFTRLGMDALLGEAGFTVERHEQRASLPFEGFELALGYGVVAET